MKTIKGELKMYEVKPYGFIYITTNLINGKKYIGQKKFIKGWERYLGSGVLLTKAIKKYGKENFKIEVKKIVYSKQELDELEKKYIKKYNANISEKYYNITEGGEGTTGYKHTEEAKEKMSKNRIRKCGKESPKYNSVIKKCDCCEKQITVSMFEFKKYKKHFCDKKCFYKWKSKNIVGEKHFNYGKKLKKETKIKIKLNHADFTGEKHPRCLKVKCLTTGKIFNYIKEAALYYGIKDNSGISKCCKGVRISCGKLKDGTPLKWEYL